MRRVQVIAVFSIAIQAAFLSAADWPTIIKPAAKQVPRIEVLAEDGAKSICSGVVLNAQAGYLLTAAHCVPGKPEDLSITVNGRHAEVARANRLLDLAVLRFEAFDEIALPLAKATPGVGAEVAVVGYAFGIEKIAVQFGRVAQALNEETKTLWLNVDLIFGDSGGAVIDAEGRLVGMASRVYHSGPAHMAVAIPVESIREFTKQYLPKP